MRGKTRIKQLMVKGQIKWDVTSPLSSRCEVQYDWLLLKLYNIHIWYQTNNFNSRKEWRCTFNSYTEI